MIIVSLTFSLRSDIRDELLPKMAKLVKASQSEEGCITYSIYADLWNPNILRIYEEWENAEALNAHENTHHFQEFGKAIAQGGENAMTVHSGGRYEAKPIN